MVKIGTIETDSQIFLAPIAGYTDFPYREIVWENGWETVFTEMISSNALVYQNKKTLNMLKRSKKQNILGMQLVGNDPAIMAEAAKLIEPYGDILDINMGCPVRKMVANKSGCYLMSNLALAEKIIKAVVDSVSIPVTVKMRTGFTAENLTAPPLAKIAEDSGAKAVFVHGRIRNQFYSGDVDVKTIKKVKNKVSIPVIANGSITNGPEAEKIMKETGADGVMIARAAIGNPWVFREIDTYLKTGKIVNPPSAKVIKKTLIKHLDYLIKYYGEALGCANMRKIAGVYLKGIGNVKELRRSIYTMSTKKEIVDLLNTIL